MKKKIGELLFQIIPVMIGVYLGLVASNWSENKKTRHKSEVFVENLLSEVEMNQKNLEKVIDYHVMLRDSTEHYSNLENKVVNLSFFQGTRTPTLIDSAYDTGIQTGVINELPLDKIQSINHIYTLQKQYNDMGKLIISGLLNQDFSGSDENIVEIARFLSVVMNDVVYAENDLIAGYELLNSKLKE